MAEIDLRSNLKAILREQGMSQLELAKKIDISPTNLNTRLSRGRNCQLSLLEDVRKTLNIDMNQLLYGEYTGHTSQTSSINEENGDTLYRDKYIFVLEENQRLNSELHLKNRELIELLDKKTPSQKPPGNSSKRKLGPLLKNQRLMRLSDVLGYMGIDKPLFDQNIRQRLPEAKLGSRTIMFEKAAVDQLIDKLIKESKHEKKTK